MIESIFTRECIRKKLADGPLRDYLPAFIQRLRTQRYAPDTMQRYVHAAATFGQWLTTQQLTVSAVSEPVLARYIVSRGSRTISTTGREHRPQSAVGLHHLLQVLRDQGIIAPPEVAGPTTPTEQVLAEYEQYLKRVHGAARLTRRKYQYFARRFLRAAFPTGELHWPALQAETITHVVQQEITGRRGFGRKHPGSAIRIFLRYLVARGLIPAGLEAAVPGMRIWTHASLPEYFSEEEILRLLTVRADGTAVGKRNYALLLLLARLGLRAQEAAHLRLDDIDWRAGIVSVRARKTHRERVLPLPEEVGKALVAYLRTGRPPTTCREIFLAHTAPYRPLQSESAVTKLVKRLVRAAGLCRRTSGAHLFRHAAATHMVRRGASFKAVADVLGHQSLQTTGIYAKLDLGTLAQVAVPWPGGAQCPELLHSRLAAYLAMREALGFRMRAPTLLLTDFVGYVITHDLPDPIRAQLAVDWACSGSSTRGVGGHAARLSVVRGFLSFLRASAPETEVPDRHLFATARRPLPYLFSADELTRLLSALEPPRPCCSLRPLLWHTFIGLLASTGLRVGEARRLTVDDVVLDEHPPHLRIVETKFRKSRLVPVQPTTADRLRHYAWQRRHLGYHGVSAVFFPSETGAVLHRATVGHVFHRLTQQLGIRPRAGGQTPTLQSLRHTFAVERLRLWYRAGLDVQALLPQLSVYLGHLHPQDTYWYLTATPELLTLAADRFQRYADAEGGLT